MNIKITNRVAKQGFIFYQQQNIKSKSKIVNMKN